LIAGETLPQDEDPQSRAIAALKAKNRLLSDGAKLVEEAFMASMALQSVLPDGPEDDPKSGPIAETPRELGISFN
jgi:hypothetical protein